MTDVPPTDPTLDYGRHLKAHRGGVILALGILSLVFCPLLGIFAWSMGNADLREMEMGIMDRSGEGTVKAGKICGMIGVIILLVNLGILVLFMACAGLAGVAGSM